MLREYFYGIMTLSVFMAIALGVAHPKMKTYVSFGSGILIICAILLPLVDIIKGYNIKFEIDNLMDDLSSESMYDAMEVAFEEGIGRYISEKYGVSESSVSVMTDGFDLETVRAERIYVTLCDKAAFLDYKRIEEEIAREFTNGGECEVTVKLG